MLQENKIIECYELIFSVRPADSDVIRYTKLENEEKLVERLLNSPEFYDVQLSEEIRKNLGEINIIFYHIPKTAGTAMRHWFQMQFKNALFWLNHGKYGGFPLNQDQIQKFRIYGGHFEFLNEYVDAIQKEKYTQKFVHCSIFREPYRQIYSHFNYVSKRPEHPLFTGVSLEETLKTENKFSIYHKNPQLRTFGELTSFEEFQKLISEIECIFGVQDKLNEFIKYLEELFNLPHVPLFMANTSVYTECSQKELQILKDFEDKYCAEDKKIWEWINKLHCFSNTKL